MFSLSRFLFFGSIIAALPQKVNRKQTHKKRGRCKHLPLKKQVWYILFLLLSSQLVQMLVQFIVSQRTSSWFYLLDSCIGALLWPVVTAILLAPQRRSVNTDLDSSL